MRRERRVELEEELRDTDRYVVVSARAQVWSAGIRRVAVVVVVFAVAALVGKVGRLS